MTKELSVTQRTSAALVNWNDKKMQVQIKDSYGKNLNEPEWNMFLALGMATGLNPFLREIWAVKYGSNPASVFIGRDGYRRSAQNHPEYEYHYVDAVYKNDTLKMVSGELTHDYNLTDRGDLIGAYCIVKRRNAGRPAFNYVELKEYRQAYGVWTQKPATMIKKVAEAQGLRGSFQELFAGTYEESEAWTDQQKPETAAAAPVASTRPEITIPADKPAPAAPAPQDEDLEGTVNIYLDEATTQKEVADIVQEMIVGKTWNADQAKRINAKVGEAVKRIKDAAIPTAQKVKQADPQQEQTVKDAEAIFATGEVNRDQREELLEDMKSQELDPIVLRCGGKSPSAMKKREKIDFIIGVEFGAKNQEAIPVPVNAKPEGTSVLDDLFAAA